MKFTETKLKGAYVIEIEPISDDRGFFARSWCQQEFSDRGLSLTSCKAMFLLILKRNIAGNALSSKTSRRSKISKMY